MTESEQSVFYKNLGDRIRTARQKAELKQEAFAVQLGLSRVSIVNIEKGRQRPAIHLLWNIARILNIEVEDLISNLTTSPSSKIEWRKIITEQISDDAQAQEKIFGFLEEIQSSKNK